MSARKPPLFVHVDVDGLWAVRACYGRPERDTFREDPVWAEGAPVLARLFANKGVPAAFFVVGRDLELDAKRAAASALWYEGYEAGNHGYSHTIGMTRMPAGQIVEEIRRTDALIRETGGDPVGFRAPGYDVDARVLAAVRRCGYRYDSSYLPTRLSPFLRLAARMVARTWSIPPRMFGRWALSEVPRVPYLPDPHQMRRAAQPRGDAPLWEFPVGVTSALGLPLTGGLLLRRNRTRLDALFAKQASIRRPLLLLLHGIDAVDCRKPIVFDTFRPRAGGLALSAERKLRQLRDILDAALRYYRPATIPDYIDRVSRR